MKPVHLFVMVAAILAAGLAVPREIHIDAAPRETLIVEGSKPHKTQSFNWYSGETVLDRAPDGHFYAQAAIDGMPVLFLVDTGASVVALTGEDAYDLGLNWNDGDLRIVGHGANGEIYGVNTVIKEITLGGIRSRNVQAVIVPEGLPVSLLGQSFLSGIGNVEISDDRMVLGPGH